MVIKLWWYNYKACHHLNKVDELSGIMELNEPSLVMIIESWLGESIPDTAIDIGCNLTILRRGRRTPGRGLLAYVHKSIPTTRLHNLEDPNKEVKDM